VTAGTQEWLQIRTVKQLLNGAQVQTPPTQATYPGMAVSVLHCGHHA
jgi:hypothetical protein